MFTILNRTTPKRKTTKMDNILCINCNQKGHFHTECQFDLYAYEAYQQQVEQYKRAMKMIPEQYWIYGDPVKVFLMNNTIKGYRTRLYWNKKNKYITPKL
jgi:hypothetical protein